MLCDGLARVDVWWQAGKGGRGLQAKKGCAEIASTVGKEGCTDAVCFITSGGGRRAGRANPWKTTRWSG